MSANGICEMLKKNIDSCSLKDRIRPGMVAHALNPSNREVEADSTNCIVPSYVCMYVCMYIYIW